MKPGRFVVPLLLVLVLAMAISAYVTQNPGSASRSTVNSSSAGDNETRIRNKLAELLGDKVRVGTTLPAADSQTYREVRVRWQSSAAQAQDNLLRESAPGNLAAINLTSRQGRVTRDRALELSPNQILVVGVDADSNLRWWKLMLDPRLVRAETSTPGAGMTSQEYYLATVEFTVPFPDDPLIKELRLYHPQWTGKEFQLELISDPVVVS
jgi:hypothetical protein